MSIGFNFNSLQSIIQPARERQYERKQVAIDSQQDKVQNKQGLKSDLDGIKAKAQAIDTIRNSLRSEMAGGLRVVNVSTNDLEDGSRYMNCIAKKGAPKAIFTVAVQQIAEPPRALLYHSKTDENQEGFSVMSAGQIEINFSDSNGLDNTIIVAVENHQRIVDVIGNINSAEGNNGLFRALAIKDDDSDTHFISIVGTNTGEDTNFSVTYKDNGMNIGEVESIQGHNASIDMNGAVIHNKNNSFSVNDSYTITLLRANEVGAFQTVEVADDYGTFGQNIESFLETYNSLAEELANLASVDYSRYRMMSSKLQVIENAIMNHGQGGEITPNAMGIGTKSLQDDGASYNIINVTDAEKFNDSLGKNYDAMVSYFADVFKDIQSKTFNLIDSLDRENVIVDAEIMHEEEKLKRNIQELEELKLTYNEEDAKLQITMFQLEMQMMQMKQFIKSILGN